MCLIQTRLKKKFRLDKYTLNNKLQFKVLCKMIQKDFKLF